MWSYQTRFELYLQLWDLRTGQLRTNLPVSGSKLGSTDKTNTDPCKLGSSQGATNDPLRLFCVTWMTQDTLICGGSADAGCVKV